MRFLASTEGLCLAPEMNNGVYVQLHENITTAEIFLNQVLELK